MHTPVCYYLIRSEVTAFLPFKLLHPQSGGLLLHPLAKQLFGGGGEFRGGVDQPLIWGEKNNQSSPVKELLQSWEQP